MKPTHILFTAALAVAIACAGTAPVGPSAAEVERTVSVLQRQANSAPRKQASVPSSARSVQVGVWETIAARWIDQMFYDAEDDADLSYAITSSDPNVLGVSVNGAGDSAEVTLLGHEMSSRVDVTMTAFDPQGDSAVWEWPVRVSAAPPVTVVNTSCLPPVRSLRGRAVEAGQNLISWTAPAQPADSACHYVGYKVMFGDGAQWQITSPETTTFHHVDADTTETYEVATYHDNYTVDAHGKRTCDDSCTGPTRSTTVRNNRSANPNTPDTIRTGPPTNRGGCEIKQNGRSICVMYGSLRAAVQGHGTTVNNATDSVRVDWDVVNGNPSTIRVRGPGASSSDAVGSLWVRSTSLREGTNTWTLSARGAILGDTLDLSVSITKVATSLTDCSAAASQCQRPGTPHGVVTNGENGRRTASVRWVTDGEGTTESGTGTWSVNGGKNARGQALRSRIHEAAYTACPVKLNTRLTDQCVTGSGTSFSYRSGDWDWWEVEFTALARNANYPQGLNRDRPLTYPGFGQSSLARVGGFVEKP